MEKSSFAKSGTYQVYFAKHVDFIILFITILVLPALLGQQQKKKKRRKRRKNEKIKEKKRRKRMPLVKTSINLELVFT